MFSIKVDEKISLQFLLNKDAQEFFNLMEKNKDYLIKFMPRIAETDSINKTRIVIENFLLQFAKNNGFKTGIFYDGTLVGICGFKYIDWNNKNTEVMNWIDSDYSGKGICTKCLGKLTEIAFDEYKLKKVKYNVSSENIASIKIAKKNGYKLEGRCISEELLKSGFTDILLFSKINNNN